MSNLSAQPQTVWTTAGGANSRRGVFRGNVEIAAKPARALVALGSVQASVVFDANDRTFVADMAGGVQAFTHGGRLLWQKRLEGGISATPAVHTDGGMLFAGTHAGWVYALDASSGSVAWRTEIPTKADARILSDLLFVPRRGAIVLSSWGGRFVALDRATGKEQQSWDAGISPCAAAAADGDENIYCLRAAWKAGVQFVRIGIDGKEAILHQQPENEAPANRALVACAPVLDQERKVVYFVANADRSGTLRAWSLERGQEIWSRHFPAAVGATPAVALDGVITVADRGGFVHAVAPDGSLTYRYASGSDYFLAGGVCDRSGTVFVADSLGVVHVIGANGVGRPIFELPRSVQARPSFDLRGNLYVPAMDRHVYIFADTQNH